MNLILWVLQLVLAVKFVSVAVTHGLRPDPTRMHRGMQQFGTAARPLPILSAVCTFLAAVGLILPAATGILTWLTLWSAALLALIMLAAVGFRLACRDGPKTVVGLVLLVLSAFVAYGRWVVAPF